MKATKILRLLVLACAIIGSVASPMANAAQTTSVTITAIQISTTSVWIKINGTWPTNGACSSYVWGVVPSTSANFDLLSTTLYDAYVNGDSVILNVSGCSTYPIITYVQLGS